MMIHVSSRETTDENATTSTKKDFYSDGDPSCDVTERYARPFPDFARTTEQERTPRDRSRLGTRLFRVLIGVRPYPIPKMSRYVSLGDVTAHGRVQD